MDTVLPSSRSRLAQQGSCGDAEHGAEAADDDPIEDADWDDEWQPAGLYVSDSVKLEPLEQLPEDVVHSAAHDQTQRPGMRSAPEAVAGNQPDASHSTALHETQPNQAPAPAKNPSHRKTVRQLSSIPQQGGARHAHPSEPAQLVRTADAAAPADAMQSPPLSNTAQPPTAEAATGRSNTDWAQQAPDFDVAGVNEAEQQSILAMIRASAQRNAKRRNTAAGKSGGVVKAPRTALKGS